MHSGTGIDSEHLVYPSSAEGLGAQQSLKMNLFQSSSPYLRAHADDPVLWREWSPQRLEEARTSNRPIFLSSGYYACHWCHVMHQESFLDPDIADRLNRNFLPIIIDRELHPAIDAYLLEFLRATRGFAGWPLNVVILPDGAALTGLVYAPPKEFAAFLDRIAAAWARDSAGLSALAVAGMHELSDQLRAAQVPLSTERARRLPALFWSRLEGEADQLAGGIGAVTKFPRTPLLHALINAMVAEEAPHWAADFLVTTLESMSRYGLRDVLSGGFFRYSETPDWSRPHFEIMLEDQAQLARIFLRAGVVFGRAHWRQWGYEILDFVLENLALEDGARYAVSLSAIDTSGQEGGYYLWTEDQLTEFFSVFPKEEWVRQYFALHRRGAVIDSSYLPTEPLSIEHFAQRLGRSVESVYPVIEQSRSQLYKLRSQRIRPRDPQSPLGVQGLFLSSLAAAVEQPAFKKAGSRLAETLLLIGRDPEHLPRLLPETSQQSSRQAINRQMITEQSSRETQPDQLLSATLADHVYVAQGLHDWFSAIGESPKTAVGNLLEWSWRRFFDGQGFFLGAKPELPGMLPQSFIPGVHRPSPSTILLNLSQQYVSENTRLEEYVRQFSRQPDRSIEHSILDHSEYLLTGRQESFPED